MSEKEYIETPLSELIINKLTKDQYVEAAEQEEINDDELYFITDDSFIKGPYESYDDLPLPGEPGYVYLVYSDSAEPHSVYDEYYWMDPTSEGREAQELFFISDISYTEPEVFIDQDTGNQYDFWTAGIGSIYDEDTDDGGGDINLASPVKAFNEPSPSEIIDYIQEGNKITVHLWSEGEPGPSPKASPVKSASQVDEGEVSFDLTVKLPLLLEENDIDDFNDGNPYLYLDLGEWWPKPENLEPVYEGDPVPSISSRLIFLIQEEPKDEYVEDNTIVAKSNSDNKVFLDNPADRILRIILAVWVELVEEESTPEITTATDTIKGLPNWTYPEFNNIELYMPTYVEDGGYELVGSKINSSEIEEYIHDIWNEIYYIEDTYTPFNAVQNIVSNACPDGNTNNNTANWLFRYNDPYDYTIHYIGDYTEVGYTTGTSVTDRMLYIPQYTVYSGDWNTSTLVTTPFLVQITDSNTSFRSVKIGSTTLINNDSTLPSLVTFEEPGIYVCRFNCSNSTKIFEKFKIEEFDGYITAGQRSGTTLGVRATAEGYLTTASGDYSHAEGGGTTASGTSSHAEGDTTTASGTNSHAEGTRTTASGYYSHAEGSNTTASNYYSHAEGDGTTSSGVNSHAEGFQTTASGNSSHAEGRGTIASGLDQHVQGKYNIEDTNNEFVEIVGNGPFEGTRSNARTLDWNGNEWLAGKLTVGAAPTNDMDVVNKKYLEDLDLVDKQYLNSLDLVDEQYITDLNLVDKQYLEDNATIIWMKDWSN